MQRSLRVAIAGGGKMAREHARSIGTSEIPSRVVGFADPDSDARDALGELVPEAAPYEQLDDLLEQETVDVVHVCTPPSTHASLARQSLEAGCHVYVEQPFATSAAEARSVLSLAET